MQKIGWHRKSYVSIHPILQPQFVFSLTLNPSLNKINYSMRRSVVFAWLLLFCTVARAQETFPVNGVADPRSGIYAFTNATIVKDAATTISNAT